MLSLDYVKENIGEFEKDSMIDTRFTKRLMDFLPTSEWEKFGYKYIGEKEFIPKEWNEENILEQLKEDVKVGIEKATNHRGISANLMFDVVKAWCKILENGLDTTEYGWYGDKLFKAVDKYYKFGLINENTFNEEFYKKW